MTRDEDIRQATLDEADEIASIFRSLGNDENVGLPADFDDQARIREWLNRIGDQGVVMVAFNGSIGVGFGAIDYSTVEPDTALLGVWISPDHRRKGLATRIANELVAYAREKGYRRIRGRLPEGNEPALSFLSAIGAMVPLRNPEMTFELPL